MKTTADMGPRGAWPAALMLATALALLAGGGGIGLAQQPAINPENQVLEIATHAAAPAPAPAPAANPAPPAYNTSPAAQPSEASSDNDVNAYTSYGSADEEPPMPSGPLPYLGIGVVARTMVYKSGEQHGLMVVSVAHNSPAAVAGVKPSTSPTSIGASGATAGALLGPAEFVMIPLLKETGQLGSDGDFIVAVDDNRIGSERELAVELSKLKPGDTLWLTVLRGSTSNPKSVRIGVKLGPPRTVAQN